MCAYCVVGGECVLDSLCYDPGPPNFHFPLAPIQTTATPPAPIKPPCTQTPAPVRPSTPPRIPTPHDETQYQRQLQDTWEEGYDTVMKSPSHHARTPSPSRTVHMKSPSPAPITHVILPLSRRRTPPKSPIVTPPPDSPPTSLTAQFLSD